MAKKDRIFGIHPVLEALHSGKSIEKVFIQRESQNSNQKEIRKLAQAKNVQAQFVPKEKLNRLTSKNHQGVVAFLSLIDYQPFDELISLSFDSGQSPFFIGLDGVTDVRNLGAIARTVECTAAGGLIFTQKGNAPVNEDAIKSSSGALLNINISKPDSLISAIELAKMSGLQVLGATEKASHTIYESDLTQPTLLVMGGEESGISDKALTKVDHLVKLPLLGKTGSLNVSVACGAILYEMVRQRKLQ